MDADRDSAKISLVPAIPSLSSITSAPNLFSSSSSFFFLPLLLLLLLLGVDLFTSLIASGL